MSYGDAQLLDRLARVFAEAAVDTWLAEVAVRRAAGEASGPGSAPAAVGSGEALSGADGAGAGSCTAGTGAGSARAPVPVDADMRAAAPLVTAQGHVSP